MAVKVFNSPFEVTQRFGVNHDYYKKWGLAGHEGLDIVPTGSDWTIFSLPFKGKVIKDIDMEDRGGNYAIHCTIWYPQIDEAWMYCHMSANRVWEGQELEPAQPIGTMGATGNTTGAHAHLNRFEVDSRGYRQNKDNGYLGGIDPLPFLQQDLSAETSTEQSEDKKRAIKLLDEYRKVRKAGPEGNYEGYVSAIIGSDRRVGVLEGDLASAKRSIQDVKEDTERQIEAAVKLQKDRCEEEKTTLRTSYQSKIESAKKGSVSQADIKTLLKVLISKTFKRG